MYLTLNFFKEILLCPQWTMSWQVACHEPHASRVMLSKALIPCTTWSWYHEQSTFLQFQRNSLKTQAQYCVMKIVFRVSKSLADYPGSFFINGTWRWEHLGYYRPCRHRLSNLLNALLKDSTCLRVDSPGDSYDGHHVIAVLGHFGWLLDPLCNKLV